MINLLDMIRNILYYQYTGDYHRYAVYIQYWHIGLKILFDEWESMYCSCKYNCSCQNGWKLDFFYPFLYSSFKSIPKFCDFVNYNDCIRKITYKSIRLYPVFISSLFEQNFQNRLVHFQNQSISFETIQVAHQKCAQLLIYVSKC